MTGSEAEHPHFKRIQRFDTDYSPTTITQYESRRTGMRVVVVGQDGPKVSGYFALATEIHDDSGAPHTLEHLCFMGSRSYQYKGVLDKLATRAYSNTNAWTATDSTVYTLDTAGWEGFAQILPVYLEHVILPTLTDAGCYTEVHHVDPEGNDAGVVYSEMQGVQNNQGELMDLKMKRLLYPESVGFRYETGGMMEQLRVLTADRIRAFHKQMYQPKNICLILVGAVDEANLLEILDTFEATILDEVPAADAKFKRPWVESPQVPELKSSKQEIVEFPEEDESIGEISISYLGPHFEDSLQSTALSVILRYLAGSSASILDNVLVEKEQVASGVYYGVECRPTALIQFSISGVLTEDLKKVEARFLELLVEATSKQLDMTFLKDCIDVEKRQLKFSAESSAQFFADPVIHDFLFGKRDGSILRKDLETLQDYIELEKWSEEDWKAHLKRWFTDNHHITVLGKPSAQLSKKLDEEEEARVAARKEKLGEEGLKQLAEKLAKATAENEKEIPKGFLEKFEVPDPTSIKFIDTVTARSGLAKKLGVPHNSIQDVIDKNDDKSPLFIQFEHIKSNFVILDVLITAKDIPLQLRPLLAIFVANFFSTHMIKDGQKVDFEDVIMELERDTVARALGSGRGLSSPESLCFDIRVEIERYEQAIDWMRRLIFDSIFDVERLEATVTRLLAEIPLEKRDGSDMASSVSSLLLTAPECTSRGRNTLVQAVYLKRVKKLLKADPEALISQLKQIQKAIFRPSNSRVLVVADIPKLSKPVAAWNTFLKPFDQDTRPLQPLQRRHEQLTELGKAPGNAAYLIPMSTIDSSFLLLDAKGPNSYLDPSVPALRVATAYLNAVEGPLWTAVRGTGLAYNARIGEDIEAGFVSLDIYRSPDAFKAFNASKNVVEDFVSGATEFDSLALEGAISSIVLSFANAEPTPASAAMVSFARQVVRGQDKDWPKVMLEKVRGVTVAQIKRVMKEFILPIFQPQTSVLVATCAPIMTDGLVKNLESLSYKPEVRTLASFHDDYGYGTADEDEDDEDDEEEEEDEEDDGGDVGDQEKEDL